VVAVTVVPAGGEAGGHYPQSRNVRPGGRDIGAL